MGTAAVGRVNVGANPATVPATGGSTTISAIVLDVNGNQLATVPVSFVSTAGTLTAAQVITDANGIAQTTLTTSTSATVTASVGAQGSTTTPPATGGGGTAGGTTPTTPTTPTSGQASGSVTVNISAAPTLVITPPTTPPSAGLPASFTFAVTVPTTNGSAIKDLFVDWGDMTSQDLGAVTGNAVISHVFTVAEYLRRQGNSDGCLWKHSDGVDRRDGDHGGVPDESSTHADASASSCTPPQWKREPSNSSVGADWHYRGHRSVVNFRRRLTNRILTVTVGTTTLPRLTATLASQKPARSSVAVTDNIRSPTDDRDGHLHRCRSRSVASRAPASEPLLTDVPHAQSSPCTTS